MKVPTWRLIEIVPGGWSAGEERGISNACGAGFKVTARPTLRFALGALASKDGFRACLQGAQRKCGFLTGSIFRPLAP